jgi:CRP-like cAMP-binding protein
VTDVLTLVPDLPELRLQPGQVLCAEGDHSGAIWVLVSGALTVTKTGEIVNRIERPGAIIGEIAVLLGSGNSATVTAESPCLLRVAADGAALLRSHPDLTAHVATGLAERLNFVTTYLADLKHQYGDAPGLSMVGDVLQRLSQHDGPRAQPGSRRDPDPEY